VCFIIHQSLITQEHEAFRALVIDYYKHHRRNFVWRQKITPYKIVVSEIMLQQTQTNRVTQKFQLFLDLFPDFYALAYAPTPLLFTAWQGLGYNRRAKALQSIAVEVVQKHNGLLPACTSILQTFPGIGPATASSISAFAYNMPTVFIETNIRTVFLHHFFKDRVKQVHDKEILALVAATLDTQNSREWYYALMDYGAFLKKELKLNNLKSVHYTKQSKFEGSERQIRGQIITLLTQHKSLTEHDFLDIIKVEPARVLNNLKKLEQEQLISNQNGTYQFYTSINTLK
jgi:A/G-specific adenine glycosylase